MDKLRELTGLVQRLGGGSGGAGGIAGNNIAEDISNRRKDLLLELPLTTRFLDQLPRGQIEKTAKENEEKAAEALRLLQRVDELVESHTTTATSLTTFLTQLSAIPSDLAKANDLAQSIHTQLTTLSTLISTEESDLQSSHLSSLQYSQDQQFSAYARERRAELERKKEGYQMQLDAFRKERLGLVREGGGTEGEVIRIRSNYRSRGSGRAGSTALASPLGMGLAGVRYPTETLGLEHVTLSTGDEGGEGKLESFFDEQEGGEAPTPLPVPPPSTSSTVIPRGTPRTPIPPTISRESSPIPISISKPKSSSRPQTPIYSSQRRKLSTPASTSLPTSLSQAPGGAGAGIIAADEDFDVDSDEVAKLFVSAKGKKRKKKVGVAE